ncbi:hypothetical protein BU16DRAFT_557775 [Lophium mytilinum]|uniref:C2H2-type domain-containing protein n=1 Tax=Lophium mytilinum TaxID=390894 RepID=A0A6A6R6E5_9PEZI|nr:hypothetical protein BU16DRAFT_557775 [Lophium mytilinum]
MAASTRAITPTHTGHFAAANAPSTPTSISSVAQPIAASQNLATRLTKSPLPGLSPRLSPQPLTGAAAMADERRHREQQAREASRQTSPNPAMAALKTLVGVDSSPVSRPTDAPPAPTQISEPLAKAMKSIVIPEQVTHDNMQTSPVSLSSFGSADSTTAPTATATEATSGPLALGSIPVDGAVNSNSSHAPYNGPGDTPTGSRAFTYPGPPPAEHDPRAPQRGMSLPGYPQNSPKSPSSTKRHKCPYCATDFTRHHNLKSHLLTHSQEKPYECPTCQARFRRLHDLKRHTKLHTGERPHTCPKCGRRFARGDALARHNKGQGGCAGRRSSFGMDDDMDGKGDESMDGVLYHGDHGDEENLEDDDDAGGRRVSEPARKRQNTGNSMQGPYHQHSSTYPPPPSRVPNMGNNNARPIYANPGVSGSSRDQSTNLSPKNAPSSISSLHAYTNQSGTFAGMTESPKPISPGHPDGHHRLGISEAGSHPGARSPSLSQQIHQQNFSRGAGRGSSPMGLPPPPHNNSNAPQLPSLPGLSSDMRINLPNKGPQAAGKAGPSLLQHQQVPGPAAQPPSNPGSMSSHTTNSGNSMRDHMGGADVWAHIREIEGRFSRQSEEQQAQIARLENEVTTLRAQLAQAGAQPQGQTQPTGAH